MSLHSAGTIYASQADTEAASATFPYAAVTENGRWLCAFRAGPKKIECEGQHVLLTWSDDEGANWRTPIAPFDPPPIEGRPGCFRIAALTPLGGRRLLATINWVDASAPSAPYFNERTEGLLDTRIFQSVSHDEGESWSALRRVQTSPFDVPTPLTGAVVKLPNDDLVLQMELNKHYHDETPWRHASVLLFSSDGGQSWPRHEIVSQDPDNRVFYWDQRLSLLPDRRLFDAFWTFDRQAANYLNIHTRHSSDQGRTWSDMRDTGLSGQPGPVFTLPDGRLAMPVVDRSGPPRIAIHTSSDDGRSWRNEPQQVIYDSAQTNQTWQKSSMQDAWAEMAAFSVGLPHVAPLPGGGALLVYYAGPETNVTGIQWARIE